MYHQAPDIDKRKNKVLEAQKYLRIISYAEYDTDTISQWGAYCLLKFRVRVQFIKGFYQKL